MALMKSDCLTKSPRKISQSPSVRRRIGSVSRRVQLFVLAFVAIACFTAPTQATVVPLAFESAPVNADHSLNLAAHKTPVVSAPIASAPSTTWGLDLNSHFFTDGFTASATRMSSPGMRMVCSIIGLFAAVAFAHVLKRRRSAQMAAWATIER